MTHRYTGTGSGRVPGVAGEWRGDTKTLIAFALLIIGWDALRVPPVWACHEYGGSFGGSECFGGGWGGDGGGGRPGEFWYELFNDFPTKRKAATAWRNAGNKKFAESDFAGALKDYEKARSIWGGRWIEDSIARAKANLAAEKGKTYLKAGDQRRAIEEYNRVLQLCGTDYCDPGFRTNIAAWIAAVRANLVANEGWERGNMAWERGNSAWGRRDWTGAEREFLSAAREYQEALKRRPNDKTLLDNLAYVQSRAQAAGDARVQQVQIATTAAGVQRIAADLAAVVSGPHGNAFFGQGGDPGVTLLPPDPDPQVNVASTIETLSSAAESGKLALTRPPEGAKEKAGCGFSKAPCADPSIAGSVPRISGKAPPPPPPAVQELISHIPKAAWNDAEIVAQVRWFAQRETDKALWQQELTVVDKQIAATGNTTAATARRQTIVNELKNIERDQNTAEDGIKTRLKTYQCSGFHPPGDPSGC